MILFRKYYKDEYKCEEAKGGSRAFSFDARYGTAFAAVVVLCIAAVVFPNYIKLNEQPTVVDGSKPQASVENNLRSVSTESDIYNYTANISDLQSVFEDEIQVAASNLEERLGKTDSETGYLYVFEIVGSIEMEERCFYLGRWKWLVDDHTSLICEFVLSDDLNEMYECSIDGDRINWNTEINLFD